AHLSVTAFSATEDLHARYLFMKIPSKPETKPALPIRDMASLRSLGAKIREFMSIPVDQPELLKAQFRALSQQLPMMYLILMTSTWAVALTHMPYAPGWLTIV